MHVVFFSGLKPEGVEELVGVALPNRALSIGDHEMLAEIGVMLTLSAEDNKVVFTQTWML